MSYIQQGFSQPPRRLAPVFCEIKMMSSTMNVCFVHIPKELVRKMHSLAKTGLSTSELIENSLNL